MSYSMWGALAETHWWFYVFFLWIAAISWKSTKPRQISMKFSIIYPILLMTILLILLPFVIKLNLYKISILALSILPGLIVGYLQFLLQGIKAIKNSSRFYLPGSWFVFSILIILLIVKFYYYNYAITLNLSLLHQENSSTIITFICGFMLGLYIARSFCLYRCMKVGPYK